LKAEFQEHQVLWLDDTRTPSPTAVPVSGIVQGIQAAPRGAWVAQLKRTSWAGSANRNEPWGRGEEGEFQQVAREFQKRADPRTTTLGVRRRPREPRRAHRLRRRHPRLHRSPHRAGGRAGSRRWSKRRGSPCGGAPANRRLRDLGLEGLEL